MEMPGRKGNQGDYRYAFNGMEKDDEASGSGNSYTTQFRQYDPRLGRWKSLDPLAGMFAGQSPYVGFNNNPIYYIDPSGLKGGDPDGKKSQTLKEMQNDAKAYMKEHGLTEGDVVLRQTDRGTYYIQHIVNGGVGVQIYILGEITQESGDGQEISDGSWIDSFDRWWKSLMGSGDVMTFGIVFETKIETEAPEGASSKIMPKDFDNILYIDYETFVFIETMVGVVDVINKVNSIKPSTSTGNGVNKMSKYQFKSSQRAGYQKNKLGGQKINSKKLEQAYDKWIDVQYNRYSNAIDDLNSNFNAGMYTDVSEVFLEFARDFILHEIALAIAGVNTSGGEGNTGTQEPELVVPHESGSYKYINGQWWHRVPLINDSLFYPVGDSLIPQEVLDQLNNQ